MIVSEQMYKILINSSAGYPGIKNSKIKNILKEAGSQLFGK
jgi:hypothetical protein